MSTTKYITCSVLVVLSIAVMYYLAGCNLPDSVIGPSNTESLQTQTAGATGGPPSGVQGVFTVTQGPLSGTTLSPRSSGTALQGTPVTATPGIPCDRAKAGTPLDVTIPDNTRLFPGAPFTKTWRLRNAGSCTWTQDYELVWFSGDLFSRTKSLSLLKLVEPGETVEITLPDLTAPQYSGTYQSNWKIKNPQGQLFGLGPNGDAPFWLRIVVVLPPTITPYGTPTPSPVPNIYIAGSAKLSPGQGIDLDSKKVDFESGKDLVYSIKPGFKHQLSPMGKVRLGVFGTKEPSYQDCQLATLRPDSVALDNYPFNTYFCYRTSLSLPGWIKIQSINPQGSWLYIEMVTWSVP